MSEENGCEVMETIDEIVREMRIIGSVEEKSTDQIPSGFQSPGLRMFADRIEAAAKREREATIEKSSINGNNASIREALEKTQSVIATCMEILNKIPDGCDYDGLVDEVADELCDLRDSLVKADLSAPPRNCDRILAKTLIGAVTLYCSKNPELPPMVEWNTIQYLEFCKWLFSESKED